MEFLPKKLPSRNTLIFLSTVSTVVGLKIYDKIQSKKILAQYQARAKLIADLPMPIDELPQKHYVLLHSPVSEDPSCLRKASEYFARYVKPVWDAGALDYELLEEKHSGDIQSFVFEELKRRRRNRKLQQQLQGKSYFKKQPKEVVGSPFAELDLPRVDGITAIGYEAYGKLLVAITDGVHTSNVNPTPKKDTVQPDEKKDTDKNSIKNEGEATSVDNNDIVDNASVDKNDTKEEKEETSVQVKVKAPLFQTQLTEEEKENREIEIEQTMIPPIQYIPFHNYHGWKSIPRRIYHWFNDRERVHQLGLYSLAVVLNHKRQFDLRSDLSTLALLDCRSDSPDHLAKIQSFFDRVDVTNSNLISSPLVDHNILEKLSFFDLPSFPANDH